MRKQVWLLSLRVLIASAIYLTFATLAHASQSITITPTSIDQSIQPGSQLTGTIQVLNQADTPFDFKVYATPYSVNGEEYDPSFSPIPGAVNVVDWISLKADSTHSQPYSGTAVRYTIRVPSGVKPGGYYAVLFAETQSQVQGSGITTRQRVGTVMYLRVAGQAEEVGRVASWQVRWFQKPNLTEVLRIENTGSVHFAAQIHTVVRDLFGASKFSYQQKREILPQKVRRITVKWPKTPPVGLFVVSGSTEFLGQTTQLPTKYVLVMGEGVRQIILLLVVICGAFSLLKLFIRRRMRRQKARADQATQAQSHDK